MQCDVGRAFVANRADRFQVARFIASTHAFVDDMANVQPGFARGVVGMGLTCNGAAHLASEAVAVQHKGSGFFGNASRKIGLWKRVAALMIPARIPQVSNPRGRCA